MLAETNSFDVQSKAPLKRLGQRIYELRRKKNVSQRELAEAVGLHRSFLSSVEHGDRTTTIKYIFAIAHYLQVDASSLFIEL